MATSVSNTFMGADLLTSSGSSVGKGEGEGKEGGTIRRRREG